MMEKEKPFGSDNEQIDEQLEDHELWAFVKRSVDPLIVEPDASSSRGRKIGSGDKAFRGNKSTKADARGRGARQGDAAGAIGGNADGRAVDEMAVRSAHERCLDDLSLDDLWVLMSGSTYEQLVSADILDDDSFDALQHGAQHKDEGLGADDRLKLSKDDFKNFGYVPSSHDGAGRVPGQGQGHVKPHDGVGLDRRNNLRFKRGQMPIEARLDLHGMGREQAYVALSQFIQMQHQRQKRCVLVITGKGKQGLGMLRHAVPQWLMMAPQRDKILRYHHAQPQDGGSGAYYILLKRQRDY
jgi:hypothetical protein